MTDWGLNLNAEGQDPDIEAVTKAAKRGADWATDNILKPTLSDSRATMRMTKEGKRADLLAMAGYMGTAHVLLKALISGRQGNSKLSEAETQAAEGLLIAKFLKRVADNKDTIDKF